MKNQRKCIGLAGFGVVGRHVYEQLTTVHRKQFYVKAVAIKHPDRHPETDIPFTTSLDSLIWDSEIEVIVEVIGGIQPAYDFIRQALLHKKSVVTANKYLIAYHGNELRKLAAEQGVQLLYEASVGGSIPILSALNCSLRHHQIRSVTGILNGSTNFILTALSSQPSRSVDDILQEARDKGFLEADPSFDLKGWDIQQKLTIIAWHAFGCRLEPGEIPVLSLMGFSDPDRFLTRYGRIKYLATICREGDTLSSLVIPTLIEDTHPFIRVQDEFNAILVDTEYSGGQLLVGKGAGGHPTACSVLADLIAIDHRLPDVDESVDWTIRHAQPLGQVYLRVASGKEKQVISRLKKEQVVFRPIGNDQYVVRSISLSVLMSLQTDLALAVKLPSQLFFESHLTQRLALAV